MDIYFQNYGESISQCISLRKWDVGIRFSIYMSHLSENGRQEIVFSYTPTKNRKIPDFACKMGA